MYHIGSRRAAHCSHSVAGTATARYATHRPTDRAACCDRRLRSAASSIGPRRSSRCASIPHPAAANPDHDSTLKFGVATSGWCISHMPQGSPSTKLAMRSRRDAYSNLLWGPLPRHQQRISTVILATAAVYIRVGNSLIACHVGCPVSRTCLSVSRLAATDALTLEAARGASSRNTPEEGLRFTTLVRRVPSPVGVSR
jgi:hypothetical protein